MPLEHETELSGFELVRRVGEDLCPNFGFDRCFFGIMKIGGVDRRLRLLRFRISLALDCCLGELQAVPIALSRVADCVSA